MLHKLLLSAVLIGSSAIGFVAPAFAGGGHNHDSYSDSYKDDTYKTESYKREYKGGKTKHFGTAKQRYEQFPVQQPYCPPSGYLITDGIGNGPIVAIPCSPTGQVLPTTPPFNPDPSQGYDNYPGDNYGPSKGKYRKNRHNNRDNDYRDYKGGSSDDSYYGDRDYGSGNGKGPKYKKYDRYPTNRYPEQGNYDTKPDVMVIQKPVIQIPVIQKPVIQAPVVQEPIKVPNYQKPIQIVKPIQTPVIQKPIKVEHKKPVVKKAPAKKHCK